MKYIKETISSDIATATTTTILDIDVKQMFNFSAVMKADKATILSVLGSNDGINYVAISATSSVTTVAGVSITDIVHEFLRLTLTTSTTDSIVSVSIMARGI